MENSKLLKNIDKILATSGIIATTAFLRLIPHPPNVAPVSALALFSGAHLDTVPALAIPLTAMLLSDLVLGFHSTMIFVYGSFAMIVCIGKFLKGKKRGFFPLTKVSLLSSILFFLITNFGVWFSGNMYPKTIAGLINAYVMGLPFFQNTVVGDLFYTFAFFYGFSFLASFSKRLALHLQSRTV